MSDYYFGYERVCPVCGNTYMAREEWGFIRHLGGHQDLYFCSWKCVRKYDSEHEKKRGRQPNELADEIKRMRENGYRPKEISDELKVPFSTVKYYCER